MTARYFNIFILSVMAFVAGVRSIAASPEPLVQGAPESIVNIALGPSKSAGRFDDIVSVGPGRGKFAFRFQITAIGEIGSSWTLRIVDQVSGRAILTVSPSEFVTVHIPRPD